MNIAMKEGMDEAKKLIQNLKIQSMPPEIYQLDELMLAEKPNMNQIANLLSKNPEILGEFLSLANKILQKTEDDLILEALAAVNLLGLQEIQRLFISCYLQKNLPVSDVDFKLIKNSTRSGIAAAELSYWVPEIGRTEAYFIAFLQDVGAIYMMRHDPENYAEQFLNLQLSNPVTAYQAELDHYHTAHSFVGSLVARRWHLGDLLCKSLLLHHYDSLEAVQNYDAKVAKMVALIQVSNVLVYRQFSDHYETHEQKQVFDHAVEFLALQPNAIEAASAALKKWGYDDHVHKASH
ncbi:HDOD domain-containing protein [Thiosulfativibrio zosterae]|uniref:HDOD domain-containing protein n=1 Tax=Thiosulfativibrio zosterae TaxID=2675053 RepID=A0A6F8PR59_9GAMM|nr:HDOD domain-containing protein [Thiosulfativibrio zosterae]BBP44599.1 hypothetical protein THMIRHAT_23450 [Thiosulfativibrio zosterae]